MSDKNKLEKSVESKDVFERIVTPKSPTYVHQGDRLRTFGYQNKGIIFDFGQGIDADVATEMLGLTPASIAKGQYSYFKPETFQDFIVCLQNTRYDAFVKYVSGDKTEEHFIGLINSFVKNNLTENLDEETIADYTNQAYGIIMDDKAPKYYAYKQESYKARIEEILAHKASFEESFVGSLPTEQDYEFVKNDLPKSEMNDEQQDSSRSIEEIVSGVISRRNQPIEESVGMETDDQVQ